jgi:hypothetical protein
MGGGGHYIGKMGKTMVIGRLEGIVRTKSV